MQRAAVLIAGLVFAIPAGAEPFHKDFAWDVPAEYERAPASSTAADAAAHLYFLKGESEIAWTERASVQRLTAKDVAKAENYLEASARAMRDDCPAYERTRVAEQKSEAGSQRIIEIWTCPRHTPTGKGLAGVHAIHFDAHGGLYAVVTGRYDPFSEERWVATEEQFKRWLGFVTSLRTCTGFDAPACWPELEAIIRADAQTLTPAEQQQLDAIQRKGREIQAQDQLAWHATDLLMEDAAIKAKFPNGAWVATADGERAGNIVFFEKRRRSFEPVWRVESDAEGRMRVVKAESDGHPPALEARIRAVHSARAAYESKCSASINHVVMADESGDGWVVYMMPATSEPNVILLGDAARVFVTSDGRKVIRQEPLAKSCRAFDLVKAQAQEHGRFEAIVTTQVVSDRPGEDLVFATLNFDVTFYVGTREQLWRVERGLISKLAFDWTAPQTR